MDGIKVHNLRNENTLLFDSALSKEGYGNSRQEKSENEEATKRLEEVERAFKNLSPSQQSEQSRIWSQFKGASEYNIYGQRGIETMSSITEGERFISYDIEAIGTPTHMRKDGSANYFSPTEIGLTKAKFENGQFIPSKSMNSSLSIAIRPNEVAVAHLKETIKGIRLKGWAGLDDDTVRSLIDLSAYAGNPEDVFKKKDINGISYTEIVGHKEKLNKNASLGNSKALSIIERGLENLVTHGTSEINAVKALNSFVPEQGGKNSARMLGYNTYNYDEKALSEFFGNIGKDNPNSSVRKATERLSNAFTDYNNIDLFHSAKSVVDNPFQRFGKNMTLTNVYDVLMGNIKPRKGTAHHALTDTGYALDIATKIFNIVQQKDKEVQSFMSQNNPKDILNNSFLWDKKPLEKGMELYAFNGLTSYNAGEYDGIFNINEDGNLEKKYAMKQNPVYARTLYKVDRFLEDVTLGGKKHFGIQMISDNGDAHVLFKETREELQKTIHGHFMPVSKYGIQKDVAMNLQNEDRARRRYNNMFEIGKNSSDYVDEHGNRQEGKAEGYNLMKRIYGNLDEVSQFKDKDGNIDWNAGEKHLKEKYKNKNWMTDAYLRDLKQMTPRLQAESNIWKAFMNETDAILGSNAEKTVALKNLKNILQEKAGENKSAMSTGGEAIMPIQVDGKTSELRGFNRNQVVKTIRSTVEHSKDGIGKSSSKVIRNRFDELIENNLLPAFSQDENMSTKLKKIQASFHKEIMASNSVSAIYEEVAGMVGLHLGSKHEQMQNSVQERVSGVTPEYSKGLANFFTNNMKESSTSAINSTQYFGQGLNSVFAQPKIREILDNQKEYAKSYLNQSGLDKSPLFNYDRKKLNNIGNVEEKIKELAGVYTRQGFRVQLFHNEDKGFSLGVLDKNAPESLAHSGYNGLRKSPHASVIHLPSLADNGKVQWRGEQHLNRFTATSKNGQLSIGTLHDDIFDTLTRDAYNWGISKKDSEILGKKNFFINSESKAERKVRGILEKSPMDYNSKNPTKDDKFLTRSERANVARSMYLDMSGLAEEWYEDKYYGATPTQRKSMGLRYSPEDIKNSLRSGQPFLEAMGHEAKVQYLASATDWAQDKWNLNTSVHGVNDRHVSKGYTTLQDARKISAFAAFDKTSGENRQKSLNYFPLDAQNVANVLSEAGESEALINLRMNYGTVTDYAGIQDSNEVNGISVRNAYMTDEQIAKSIAINRSKIDTELKKMLGNNEITMEEYKKYQSMLDNGQLSTYEGKAILANKFKQVFDVTEDVRKKLTDGFELSDEVQGLIKNQAEKQGATFSKDESIMFKEGGYVPVEDVQSLIDKDGKITVGSMVVDGQMEYQKVDVRNNKELFIKGWNAEEQTLILGKHNRGEDSMKTVTNTGRRHIETFVPQSVLEIVSGFKGTESIVPHFSDSKGMDGARLEEKVRLYEDELIKQVHGVSEASPEVQSFLEKHQVTVGTLAKDGQAIEGQAIKELLLPKLHNHFNVDESTMYERNGRLVVSSNYGFNDELSNFGNGIKGSILSDLDKDMGTVLDRKFRENGVELGQVIKQKHDTWSDQYAVGVGEGRVRIGLKELSAMESHMGSKVTQFYQEEVLKQAKGGQAGRDIGQYIVNGALNDFTPKAGDVVFDTSVFSPAIKEVFDPTTNQNVEINARIGEGGVLQVNPADVKNMPEITMKQGKIFAEEYAGTMLNAGKLNLSWQDENGELKNSTPENYLKADGKFQGTSYLKLPSNIFGREHMPLIDFDNFERKGGEGGYINELQRSQKDIVKMVSEYNLLGRSGVVDQNVLQGTKERLEQSISTKLEDYETNISRYATGGAEGDLFGQTANSRLDVSGHFRADGVNPFAQYEKDADGTWKNTGKIQENVLYLNKNDFFNMVDGVEDNIIKTWKATDSEMKNLDISKIEDKKAFIAENMNTKGIYGTTIRYPIISNDTIQTTKFEIADWVGEKSAFVGTGTISRIAGDFDGDNLAALLTTYKSKASASYHLENKANYEKERVSSEFRGNEVMKDLESDMLKNLTSKGYSEEDANKVIMSLNSPDKYTVQDLAKDGFDNNTIKEVMRAKTHVLDNTETVIARTGKEYIGHIDNARQRISSLHNITQDVLVKAGAISQDEAQQSVEVVNEVVRRLSQDSISSKKFTVQNMVADEEIRTMTQEQIKEKSVELAQRRNQLLENLKRNLYNSKSDVEETIGILDDLGVIKSETKQTNLEVGVGRENPLEALSERDLFRQGLTEINKTGVLNAHVGSYRAASLGIAGSKGIAALAPVISSGQGFVFNDSMKKYYAQENETVRARMDNLNEAHISGILRQHERNSDAEELIKTSREAGSPSIESRAILEANHIEGVQTARFRDVLDDMIPKRAFGGATGGAMAAGAVGFGAMWAAGSALKTSPTPEGMKEQQQPIAVNPDSLGTPTARITQNTGEHINIQVSAKNAKNMTSSDISALVSQELQAMSSMKMDMNVNVNDNSQKIDQKWLQDVVANAMNKGYGY